MNEFWQKLSERERRLVFIGGGAVAIFILLQFILVPMFGWRTEMEQKRNNAVAFYDLVARASAFGGAAVEGEQSTPVRNLVTESAPAAGIELNFVNQRPDNGVDLNATASPDVLFAWLTGLERDHGVVVAVADIARETGSENVRAQLTLVRRAAW
jgi:type II secretory pathway component PulM